MYNAVSKLRWLPIGFHLNNPNISSYIREMLPNGISKDMNVGIFDSGLHASECTIMSLDVPLMISITTTFAKCLCNEAVDIVDTY